MSRRFSCYLDAEEPSRLCPEDCKWIGCSLWTPELAHQRICILLRYSFSLHVFPLMLFTFVSSVRSSYSHPDLLLTHHHHPTHFFRSHRSSTLDFHFLSHYSYIKAIMLYKGKTWQDSGILWNTLAYSGIPWHTLAYSGIL